MNTSLTLRPLICFLYNPDLILTQNAKTFCKIHWIVRSRLYYIVSSYNSSFNKFEFFATKYDAFIQHIIRYFSCIITKMEFVLSVLFFFLKWHLNRRCSMRKLVLIRHFFVWYCSILNFKIIFLCVFCKKTQRVKIKGNNYL